MAAAAAAVVVVPAAARDREAEIDEDPEITVREYSLSLRDSRNERKSRDSISRQHDSDSATPMDRAEPEAATTSWIFYAGSVDARAVCSGIDRDRICKCA